MDFGGRPVRGRGGGHGRPVSRMLPSAGRTRGRVNLDNTQDLKGATVWISHVMLWENEGVGQWRFLFQV